MPMGEAVVRVCDPHDDDQTLATATIRYVFEGEWYTVDVCEECRCWWAETLTQIVKVSTKLKRMPSMLSYELASCDPELLNKPTRTELERRFLPPASRGGKVHIPPEFQRTGEVINHDAEAEQLVQREAEEIARKTIRDWGITDHAYQRMNEREIHPTEVWRALQNLAFASEHPGGEPNSTVITYDDLSVVINRSEQVVLTVYRKSAFATASGD